MTTLTLTPWEREWAGYVGVKRHEANADKRDSHYYDPARMEDNLTASTAAACSEIAVARHLNKYWDGSFWTAGQHSEFRERHDVGENTEVRRTKRKAGALVVRKTDVDRKRLMVLAHPVPDDFVVVHIIGWAYAVDVWDLGRVANYDRDGTTRLVGQEFLNPL